MSYIRATETKKYSKSTQPLYAFLSGPHEQEDSIPNDYLIEAYGDMKYPEHFVEVVCRILDRAGVSLTLEEVNKLRNELMLDELDHLKQGGYRNE